MCTPSDITELQGENVPYFHFFNLLYVFIPSCGIKQVPSNNDIHLNFFIF